MSGTIYNVTVTGGTGIFPDWILTGTGSPEGVKTAAVGSLYARTDGKENTTLYVKEVGAGNTGWNAAVTVDNTTITEGTGSPESSVTATVGSIYRQTDATGTPSVWVKESGTGNTGWGGITTALNTSVAEGAGSPEGSVTASVGSVYRRTDGAANTSVYIKESGAGNTGWSPVSTAATAYAAATLDSASNTTITTGGTYYPIVGTFTNNPMVNFIFDTDHIEYTGATTRYFEVDWHASIETDGTDVIVHCGVSVNSAAPVGLMGMICKAAGDPYAVSGTCVVELATDDEIQLVTTSDDTGGVSTFNHFTTTIRAI